MATTTRTVNFACNIRLTADGNFLSAQRIPTNQCLVDGVLYCQEQQPAENVTLAQLKTFVANLS